MKSAIILTILFTFCCLCASAESLTVTITTGPYQITSSDSGDEIALRDFGRLLIPGKPNLPSRIFAIAVPPGAQVTGVTFDLGPGNALPGTYEIPPAPLPRVVGEEDPQLYERDLAVYNENLKAVYGSDDPYPEAVGEFVRRAAYRKYNLVDVRINPFVYHPKSGRLLYFPEVQVNVEYTPSAGPVMADNLARPERTAREIIYNYDQAQEWYPGGSAGRGLHDYVIITTDSLTPAVSPLIEWETAKGRTVEVVTTSWINSSYTGYDLAAKVREFLREKYPSDQWGIEDVLLVGHYDHVPMRLTWQDIGYGKPETDYYYAELSLADQDSWDKDGDHRYGEDSDPIDFYTEVNVGRIPWSDYETVENICSKSAAYEQSNDPSFKKNILLLGAWIWWNTDCAVLMEAKADQPWMADWTTTRMYEKNNDYWSDYDCDLPLHHSNVLGAWANGSYAFVNWAGHGSPWSSHIYGMGGPAFIESSDCPYLNDDYPAIIFGFACSNSDSDHLSIGQAMMKQGAVGFLGANKPAYGKEAWRDPTDGSGQSFDYFFTTCCTSTDYTQGQGHQWALRTMYTHGYWYQVRYEMFEWGSIFGNPDLGMGVLQRTYAPDPEPYCSGALFGEPAAGYPGWVWFSIPLIPDDPTPEEVLGFDCGGRLWMFDPYDKATQVYQPPHTSWDLFVGRSYLLYLDGDVDNPRYSGDFPAKPFRVKLGRAGWTWIGMPGTSPLGHPDFMDAVRVQYPVGGQLRTAAQDRISPAPWLNWGWSFWDTHSQASRTLTPYAPFGCNTSHPWLGYRAYVNVGTAQEEEAADQATLIWP